MAATAPQKEKATDVASPWRDFQPGLWQREVNVRDFIQQNYTLYEGDAAFLEPATTRTLKIWETLQRLFTEERRKGVLDVSQIPSSITAHGPGYIDRENELIVGLQTDAPLKRAIMPNGGFRMVLTALKTYGYEPDPAVVETFTKCRKTHNDAVFDAYTADIRAEVCLNQLQLWDKRQESGRSLSSGMKRRLMIARALMHQPKLLILDEPTARVDIEIRRSMWDFLRGINEAGTTIILTTHYLEEAENLCRHVAIIDNGQIIVRDEMAKVLRKLNAETFVLNLRETAQPSLRLGGYPVEWVNGHEIEVEVTRDQDLNGVFERLSAAGLHVASMRNKANRLEELFLRLTAREPPPPEPPDEP